MSNSQSHPDDPKRDQPEKRHGKSSRVERRHEETSAARELRHADTTAVSEKSQLTDRVITVEIPPQTEFVRVARLAATGVASRMRFTYDQIEDIKLAISEACNNAILHARPLPGTGNLAPSSIVVRFWPHDDRLEISVEDGGYLAPPGLPLKTFAVDDEEVTFDDLPEGGMGLMLIQALMDEVKQPLESAEQTSSTTLHMTKRLRPL